MKKVMLYPAKQLDHILSK